MYQSENSFEKKNVPNFHPNDDFPEIFLPQNTFSVEKILSPEIPKENQKVYLCDLAANVGVGGPCGLEKSGLRRCQGFGS